jgi:hypothetical protein
VSSGKLITECIMGKLNFPSVRSSQKDFVCMYTALRKKGKIVEINKKKRGKDRDREKKIEIESERENDREDSITKILTEKTCKHGEIVY